VVGGSDCSAADESFVGKGSAVVGRGCSVVVVAAVVVGRGSVVLICPGWVGCGPRDQCGPIDVRIKKSRLSLMKWWRCVITQTMFQVAYRFTKLFISSSDVVQNINLHNKENPTKYDHVDVRCFAC
jgi:hypothetical protein